MKRLSRLDGLRGVLASYIMLGHALPFTDVPGWLAQPFHHGEAAVDLFFALSGLVIVNSLAHFEYRFWRFFTSRAWRLLPVYFTVLTLAVGLIALGSPIPAMQWVHAGSMAGQFWAVRLPAGWGYHLAAHVLLVHGLLPQGVLAYAWVTLLGPAWSLSTEWQFYIVMALAMGRWRNLAGFTWAMLALALAWRLAAPQLPPYWQFSRAFLPDAAGYFALGLASAVWLREGKVLPLVCGVFLVTLLGLFSFAASRALIPLGWVVVVMAQRHSGMPWLPRLLDSRMAQYLARISYPLYLLNEPVQRGMAMLIAPLTHGNAPAFTWLWLPLALTAPIAAAHVLHKFVEKPLMKGQITGFRRARHDNKTEHPGALEPERG